MATKADVRRIALSFPETEESKDDFAFGVWNKDKLKGFARVWKERVNPKKPRVPNHAVMAIRTANVAQRDALLAVDSKKFFTEPHYNGFPAVLVRLEAVTAADLKVLIADAWASSAPKDLVQRGRK